MDAADKARDDDGGDGSMMRWRRPRGVHVGREGWMFWLGRRGETAALYRSGPRVWLACWRWGRLLVARRARAAALGCRYLQAVVPDKLSIYDDMLGAPVVEARLSPGLRLRDRVLRSAARDAWVDLFGPLRAQKPFADTFFRTDTHWSYEGCVAAYRQVCAAIGIPPAPYVLDPVRLDEQDFVFDLGRKLTPPVRERLAPAAFDMRTVRHDENALARLRRETGIADAPGLHVGSRIVLRQPDPIAAPLRIVLFGDSFSSETGYTLAVMLGEAVAELHAIWSADIDWDYVARVRPDILIHEIAERFLWRVPHDRIAIDAFAEARVQRYRRTTGR